LLYFIGQYNFLFSKSLYIRILDVHLVIHEICEFTPLNSQFQIELFLYPVEIQYKLELFLDYY